VYFADLVSKSAQYCFVDKKDPVGLMLLSEVALGEMYQLRGAKVSQKSTVVLISLSQFRFAHCQFRQFSGHMSSG
jgi:Poly(ADP-ribose) polymerase catalytic domain